jgi:subtilisin family serine protease
MVAACTSETGFCKGYGTSDATALASASAALIWSKHPNWTNNQVLRVMLNTVGGPTNGAKRNDSIGYGIVRPRVALESPGDPGPADVYPLPDLAAAASPKTSGAQGKATAANGEESAASSSSKSNESNTMLWVGVGVGAALAVGVAVAALAAGRRRRSAV